MSVNPRYIYKKLAKYKELLIITFISIAVFFTGSLFNIFDNFLDWLRTNNTHPFDEIIFVLLILAVVFFIFFILKWSDLKREISVRQSIEDELRGERDRIHLYLDVAGVIFVALDKEGKVTLINKKGSEILGYPKNEIEGKDWFENFLPSSIKTDVREIFDGLIDGRVKPSEVFQQQLKSGNGGERTILWHNTLLTDSQGNVTGTISSGTDITEKVKAEEALARSEQKYRVLFEAHNDALFVHPLLDDGYGEFIEVNDIACKRLGYSRNELLKLSPNDLIAPEDVIKRGEEGIREKLHKDKWQIFEVVQITKQGKRIPVEISSRVFDLNGRPMIMSLARDITDRKLVEEALKQSERDYRELFENAHDAIIIFNPDDETVLNVNHRACEIYGFDRSEFIGMSLEKITKNIEPGRQHIKETIENLGSVHFETVQYKKDGTELFLEINSSVIDYRDRKVILSINRDITERLSTLRKLRDSEQRYRNIFDYAPVGIYQSTPGGNFLTVNSTLALLLGYDSTEELMHRNLQRDIYWEPDERRKLIAEYESIGSAYHLEVPWKKKDGTKIWISLSAHAVKDEEGNTYFFEGFVHDITERKITEENIKQSEIKYKTVANWTYDWEYWLSPEREVLYMSPSVERITGYKVDDFINEPDLLDKIIHEDDKMLWDNHHDQLPFPDEEDTHLEYEFRIYTKDNNVKWVQHICRNIYDSAGEYRGRRASNRDITENKKAMEVINKLSTAVAQNPLSILITDKDAKIEYVNEMCTEITGYPVQELIGQNARIFQSGFTSNGKYKEMWDTILAGETWKGELLNKRKNGELYWESIFISPIFDTQNRIANFIAIKEDVTERKQIEEELKEYREHLESVVEERTLELSQSEAKFRALAENSKDIIIRFSTEFECLYANPMIESLTGIPPEDFLGHKLNEFDLDLDLISTLKNGVNYVYSKKEIHRKEFVFKKDRWIDWLMIPEIDESGDIISVVTSGRDISAIKEYEMKVQDALNQEKELNELKSKFISTASHEFRTPLAAILSSSQMIQRYARNWDEEKLNVHHDRIYESVKNLTELMDDVLLISKTEQGRLRINPERFKVEEIFGEIVSEHEHLLKKDQQINFVNNAGNKSILIDKKLLGQIVGNLISNAIKYSGEGSEVIINTDVKNGELIIVTDDAGIGIDENELPFVFDPFYRTKNAIHFDGTGLGLNIVKRIVDMLDGDISVKSEIDKGTSFRIKIPVQH